jgi:hypothetical protein
MLLALIANRRVSIAVAALLVGLLGNGRVALATELPCGGGITVTDDFTLGADYYQTSDGNCFNVTVSGKTVNLANHKIICRKSGYCGGAAVATAVSGVTVRNGSIVSDTGDWGLGVNCTTIGTAYFCTAQDLYIENGIFGGILGAGTVENSVIVNSTPCIGSLGTLPSSGRYFQNFCQADDVGFSVSGPSSGSFTIERNLIRTSASGADGILINAGNVTIQRNLIEADDPIDDTNAGTVTLSTNVCSDAGQCPLPTSEPFTFNLDF